MMHACVALSHRQWHSIQARLFSVWNHSLGTLIHYEWMHLQVKQLIPFDSLKCDLITHYGHHLVDHYVSWIKRNHKKSKGRVVLSDLKVPIALTHHFYSGIKQNPIFELSFFIQLKTACSHCYFLHENVPVITQHISVKYMTSWWFWFENFWKLAQGYRSFYFPFWCENIRLRDFALNMRNVCRSQESGKQTDWLKKAYLYQGYMRSSFLRTCISWYPGLNHERKPFIWLKSWRKARWVLKHILLCWRQLLRRLRDGAHRGEGGPGRLTQRLGRQGMCSVGVWVGRCFKYFL